MRRKHRAILISVQVPNVFFIKISPSPVAPPTFVRLLHAAGDTRKRRYSMTNRNIITLTTDYGLRDFYVGALKGTLLRHCPDAQVVDISHLVPPYDLVQGAFVLQQSYSAFPEGTLHMVAVNCFYAPNFHFVLAKVAEHYFLAPDNGLLTLIFGKIPVEQVRRLEVPDHNAAGVQALFGQVAAQLFTQPFELLGEPTETLTERIRLQPVLTPSRIRATVIHIDNFDNAILNLTRDTFERTANGRPFTLFFKRFELSKLSENYCDVPIGEALCRFNDAGLLEIAMHMGRAATLLGLQVEESVEIVFS